MNIPDGWVIEEEDTSVPAAPAAAPAIPEGFVLEDAGTVEAGGANGEASPAIPEDEGLVGTVTYEGPNTGIPEVGDAEAAWAGMKSGALRGFDDELAGFSGAVGNKIGGMLGMNKSTAGFWDIYEAIQESAESDKANAFEQNTLAYGLGFAPGMLFGPSVGAIANGASRGERLRRVAAIGGAEGAVSGAGNADDGMMNRAGGALEGAAIGAAVAPVAAPLAERAVNIGGKMLQRVGGRENSLNSGLDVLGRAAPQDAPAMRARADELEAANVPARLVDVMDSSGRGVVRAAAGKMTPARNEVEAVADEVYSNAQDRIADQARRNISSAPRTSREIRRSIEAERAELGPRFDAVRNAPVDLTPELIQVFGTTTGRQALTRVARYMTPAEQGALGKFTSAIRSASTLDPALPEPVRMQIMSQLMEGNPLTVDIADKFTRIVKKMGTDDGMARVANDMGNAVRGAARAQHPEYDAALIDFERLSGVADAAAGTGKYAEDDFLRASPDEYARVRSEASADPVTVDSPDGPVTYPAERTVAEVRARDEVVDRATSGRGASAVGVARQLSEGSAQRQRNRVLLGEDDAGRLERGMAAEVQRVENTRYIDPRQGSKTAGMQEDQAQLNESMNFVADAATPGFWGPVRAVARWFRNQGIRGVDAERLVRDAVSEDPARLRQAIDYLERRGLSRERSRSLVRTITAQMAGRTGGALSGDRVPRKPARSVRAVLEETGRE